MIYDAIPLILGSVFLAIPFAIWYYN